MGVNILEATAENRVLGRSGRCHNPVITDIFTQLNNMEKRSSGLRKMRELTENGRLPIKEKLQE